MTFRTKEDFIHSIKEIINKMEKDEHIIISFSPHIIKETIKDEHRYLKKRIILEWEILDDLKREDKE